MSSDNTGRLIRTLAGLLVEHPPPGISRPNIGQIEALLGVYYRHIDDHDLEGFQAVDLLGSLVAHWHLMRQRLPHETKLRVYNPDQEAHGWRSDHTIVEIVTPDVPFLVDSVTWALNRRGLTIHLTLHPVFAVVRDSSGSLVGLHDPGSAVEAVSREAVMRLHVDRQPETALEDIERLLTGVLADVQAATSDWLRMRQMCTRTEKEFGASAAEMTEAEREEGRAFLTWMYNDHFLFLASCQLGFADASTDDVQMRPLAGTGLGLLGAESDFASRAEVWIAGLGSDVTDSATDLMITKANARSTVHRPAYMDLVAVKLRDEQGRLTGLLCFIGLFSSSAYSTPPRQIPLLRQKIADVFAAIRVAPNSHSGRQITNILDNFPRDTLFQISVDDLQATALGLLALQERQRTRLFIVRDPFRRFYSCLVYLPRERYSREVRVAVQELLSDALDGTDVVYETHFSESILARIYYVVVTRPGSDITYDIDELEQRVAALTVSWQDGLRVALGNEFEETQATRYMADYGSGFPSGYREDFHPRIAVNDIRRIEQIRAEGRLGVHLYHPLAERRELVHVRLYALSQSIPLSQVIPILEHLGLRVLGERPYCLRHHAGDAWIHDFSCEHSMAAETIDAGLAQDFTETFLRVWEGKLDDDGFNGLVLRAGLSWKQALLFRAYARYQHQIRVQYTQDYLVTVLNHHPVLVQVLARIFQLRFDPGQVGSGGAESEARARFEALLNDVESLDEDTILRRYLGLIDATLRTNYYQRDASGDDKNYLSFKFDPHAIEGMPLPLPMYEIFVFSRYMEGVHLRGGRVARGGLRWSDRMEDYRTEILGLMKAQMVKNTVIVPVGSKGGFVVRNAADSDNREVRQEKGIAAYRTLLRGMLDITDNLSGTDVVPPTDVVRHDDDDPYLVIAADKGTATFSDIANAVSSDYGFWLGDAFASGGSAGYDHKAMGITARGAWESVKRNFRELGVDIQSTDFTVVGIGDMSGDVFGNGMLLSPHIKLVAAFNHRHIFIDPDPDPAVSFAERERLFRLPRSSWSDYDRSLISQGGGVYARTAKSITLEANAQRLFGLTRGRVTPNELISAILRAQVDLLWNGGIGTYVKSSQESHIQAHDKTNDDLRVNASELRCRVIGEGGNLGLTQLARIEFALRGGLLYTDAIDNSAGVDCSDHEVNIKILLDQIVADGDMTGKQRNRLLSDMTDDVAALVLADNYAQTQAVSIVAANASDRLYEQARFMDLLEQRGGFDRQLEGLPDRKAINERQVQGRGLTKPEISVLLAYSKMNFFDAIVQSDIPDDPFVVEHLVRYFPNILGERFEQRICAHRLRREIVATVVAGGVANRFGPGVGFRIREEVGCDVANVARAYLAASAIFGADQLWRQVEQLDNQVSARIQIDMLNAIARFLERVSTAMLREYRQAVDMVALVDRYRDGVCTLWHALPKPLAAHDRESFERQMRRLAKAGVPKDLAKTLAGLESMAAALDIVSVSMETGVEVEMAAWIYSALNHTLQLDWINDQLENLAVQTHWHLLARTKLDAALLAHRRGLTAQILEKRGRERTARGILENWVRHHRAALAQHEQLIDEFRAGSVFDFAIMSLIVAGVGELLPATSG
ncbi:MAG: NAD-glutamate dehydrogenase [Gammaproteobacteria bacterium]|nr:NAD-glutamate dehydrogenase [Gammaproteobacteria bacterium]